MKRLIAFDLDGTLAASKQPLEPDMADALADLLAVADVAVISGGDWPQFDKQVASRLPDRADRTRLWLMPTTGTKLYTFRGGAWSPVYAELFDDGERHTIIAAFDESLQATGFVPEQSWGERIEDRGSQITFSALGQQAPLDAKEKWDPDHAKRKLIQADLKQRVDLARRDARGRRPGRWAEEAQRRKWHRARRDDVRRRRDLPRRQRLSSQGTRAGYRAGTRSAGDIVGDRDRGGVPQVLTHRPALTLPRLGAPSLSRRERERG